MFEHSHQRVAVAALLLALAVAGCRSNGAKASDARIHADAGKVEIVFGARRAELPAEDVAGKDLPPVVQDDPGRRLAYRTSSGMARVLYVVGEGLFVGPLVSFPVDFKAVPDLDHALGPLFETAGARRSELVREVRRDKGDSGVVRLLIDAAYVDDAGWDEARKQLPPASEAALRDGLAGGLDPGKSPILLRRAVSVLDLRAPSRAKVVAARAKELASGTEEPRAAAALLRAVIANDEQQAAEIGCEVLSKQPARPAAGEDGERGSLVEAATLAIAAAGATCSDPKLLESVLADPCAPWFRCTDAGPVAWGDTSNQDEPLCTKEQLAKVVAAELERPPSAALEGGARPSLFAYAALAAKERVPAGFVTAQARRRYALVQPAEPACDAEVPPGTPCRCDEATVRLYACKEPTSSHVHVGVCRFDVDDKQKKIQNVVASAPP